VGDRVIRLAWRQLRLPTAATTVLLVTLAVFLALTRQSMDSYLRSSGLAGCLAAHGSCGEVMTAFVSRYSMLLGLFALVNVVPLLIGLFWGAPLIAREVEAGTHRLAWTQSVSRRRWLAVKLGMCMLGAGLVAVILGWLITWWSHPFARIGSGGFNFSRINANVYDFTGTVPVAYTLYAFAFGTAAGALIRRTVPAMGVTIAGYLMLRIPMESIRGHLLPALTITYPTESASPRAGLGDWILSSTPIDRAGHAVAAINCPGSKGGGGLVGAVIKCIPPYAFRRDVYQPLSRFWALQGAETGIVLAVTLALLATAAWWTVRRIS
jgi:hypothetical protein